MKIRFLFLIVIGALLLAGCQGLAGEPRIVATIPPRNGIVIDEAALNSEIGTIMTMGSAIWSENCVRCHGQMGGGTEIGTPLPDLTDKTDEEILASITNGVIRDDGLEMPAFGEILTAEELNAAMTFSKMMSRAITQGMVQSESTGASVPVIPASTGVVTGTIRNGTANGVISGSQMVTLHVIKSAIQEQTFDVQVGEGGAYRFDAVPFDSTYQYVVTAIYGDLSFASNIVTLDSIEPEINVPVTIYETALDADAIVIDGLSSQVFVQNDMLQMIQIVSFTNTSDKAFFQFEPDISDGSSVSLRLPQGATLSGSANDNYRLSADGVQVIETRPLLPGQSRLMHLSYTMPYEGTANLSQVFDYRLNGTIEVVVSNTGLTLTSTLLPNQEAFAVSGQTMQRYTGTINQSAGSTVQFTVAGQVTPASAAATASPDTANSPLAYILIGAGAASLLIAGILTLWERLIKNNRKGQNA